MKPEVLFPFCKGITENSLEDHQNQRLTYQISLTNWVRMRYFLAAVGALVILVFLTIDIPYMKAHQGMNTWFIFTGFGILFLVVLTVGVGISLVSIFLKNQLFLNPKVDRYLSPILGSLILAEVILYSGMEFIAYGSLTLFQITLVLFAACLILPLRMHLSLIAGAFVVYCLGMSYFIKDGSILSRGMIEMAAITLIAMLLAYLVNHSTQAWVAKNILFAEASKKLQYLSTHDQLTGLTDRATFEKTIDREVALCKRYKHNSTLVMVDIDRFRKINESYDHEVAEEVLHQVARILALNVREVDYVARWSGEEFLILIPRTPLYGGYKLSKRIQSTVADNVFKTTGHEIRLTASFAIVPLYPAEEGGFQQSLAEMTQAISQAKEDGFNQVVVATPAAVPD